MDSYGNPVAILSAANVSGADAIHQVMVFCPNTVISPLMRKMNIKFIGPNSEIIRDMGNKQMRVPPCEKPVCPLPRWKRFG